MTWTPRRVVTGHDADGTSVFLSDGPPPVTRTAAGTPATDRSSYLSSHKQR